MHPEENVRQQNKNKGPQARAAHPWRRRFLLAVAAFLLLLMGGAGFLGWQLWRIQQDLPDVSRIAELRAEQPSIVLSADGKQLTQFKNMQRQWVKLEQISPWVVKALLATEDRRFYQHKGVDFRRTAGAAWHSLRGDLQGGSTLTQQLARNLFPEEIGKSRNLNRKVKEMLTALAIERTHSKSQILEIYLNTVPFLYNVFGIEMAARTYFNKNAMELGPLESATLVGMLKGTTYYNPVVNPERARDRRNTVLMQLARSGELPLEKVSAMRRQPLALHFTRQAEPGYEPALHYVEYVRRWLTDWAEKNDVDLYTDGLIIHATLDTRLQEFANEAVERQTHALQAIADVEWTQKNAHVMSNSAAYYLKRQKAVQPFQVFWQTREDLVEAFVRESAEYRKAVDSGKSPQAVLAALRGDAQFMQRLRESKTRLEAGMVAMDPASGAVRAWVGSRNFMQDQFDHVAQALRQPGSTFKPLVYGAALERGFSPTRTYMDSRVAIRTGEGESWTPTDMNAGSEMPMTMRDGLIYSRNTVTAQVMQDVGLPGIVALARAAGINRSRLDPVPSLALGTSPVSLLEMVSAYSTIAAIGQFHAPQVVQSITDRRGKLLARFDSAAQPPMSENTALELIDMMRGVINRGTGTEIRTRFAINADVAGKTGTTQFNTDGWFIMAHPALVTGAWVGFNDARVTMRSNYWGQGGHNALTLVGDFYKTLFKNKSLDPRARFPKPQRGEWVASEPWLERGGSGGGTEGALLVRRESDGAAVTGDPAPAMNGSGGTKVGGNAGGITVAGGESARSAAEDAVAAARTAARNAIEALQSAGGR